jgi:hypothetical protein
MRFKAVLLLAVIAGLLAACGSQGTKGPSFSIELSGATDKIIVADKGSASLMVDDSLGEDMIVYTLNFNDSKQGLAFNILFYGNSNKPRARSYTITPLDITGDLNGQVGALVLMKTDDSTRTFVDSSGTITFDSEGDSYSGSFEFAAVEAAMDTTEDIQSVFVKGTFSGVPAS